MKFHMPMKYSEKLHDDHLLYQYCSKLTLYLVSEVWVSWHYSKA